MVSEELLRVGVGLHRVLILRDEEEHHEVLEEELLEGVPLDLLRGEAERPLNIPLTPLGVEAKVVEGPDGHAGVTPEVARHEGGEVPQGCVIPLRQAVLSPEFEDLVELPLLVLPEEEYVG